MEMVRVEINIPKDMTQFVVTSDSNIQVKRNALLLYPYIENRTISHGKAAELLGMPKLDLISLLSGMGIAYFNMDIEEVDGDMATIRQIRRKSE
jgi:predicted HTH domain antitoxin